MRDRRNSDLKRKMSQMRGQHIHTFEFQVYKNEANFREITIKCIIKLLKENLGDREMKTIAQKLRKSISLCTLYEFYSVISIITDDSEDRVERFDLDSAEVMRRMLRETDFISQMGKINEFRCLQQILMSHEEQDTIEGLPEVKPEVTIVLSFRCEEEVIVISD